MNEFQKFNGYYFRINEGDGDSPICQYMRLEYFIKMLETQKYYVRRRKYFDDINEGYKDIKLSFAFVPVGENTIPQIMSIDRIIPYAHIDCPTACWSKKKQESFLMWKCYATEMGVCIKTTIHNFIASIKENTSEESDNRIVCGSVDYKDFRPSANEECQLFDKDSAYADEEEFRFYFYFPSYFNKDKEEGIFIPVDTNVMIDEVLLSPFICKETADKFAQMIRFDYNINVRQSSIKLKY